MRLISARYPSSWELKHAYSTDEAMALVKQHLDSGQDIEGMGQLRSFLMLDFDSEVIKQVEEGEWLLIKDEAYYFDWGQFDKSVRQQCSTELMRSTPYPKSPPIQVFRVIDSETGEPLIKRRYIAVVDGEQGERRTDALGITHITDPPKGAKISMRVIFSATTR